MHANQSVCTYSLKKIQIDFCRCSVNNVESKGRKQFHFFSKRKLTSIYFFYVTSNILGPNNFFLWVQITVIKKSKWNISLEELLLKIKKCKFSFLSQLTKALTEHCLQGNVPLKKVININHSFMPWWRYIWALNENCPW